MAAVLPVISLVKELNGLQFLKHDIMLDACIIFPFALSYFIKKIKPILLQNNNFSLHQ